MHALCTDQIIKEHERVRQLLLNGRKRKRKDANFSVLDLGKTQQRK
jgi:hypothetical protein